MQHPNLSDTQPAPRGNGQKPRPSSRRWLALMLWAFLTTALLGSATVVGGVAGFDSAEQTRRAWQVGQAENSLQAQYELAMQDLQERRYDMARQRLEYILEREPEYPGAAAALEQALQVLHATATPTPTPLPTATVTATPTRDLRPVQDLIAQAQRMLASEDWTGVIDTLVALRAEDSAYQVTQVDGMLFVALRGRGIQKIYKESNLVGGIYDLSLAEDFGPLDGEAHTARNLARLYLFGSSFWEAFPERAVYYFQQVASAAPYLRDASGWTATERYRGALIQYGDELAAREDWCNAESQYRLALQIRDDAALQSKAANAGLICSPPTATPAPATATPEILPTETLAPPVDPPTWTPPPPVDPPTATATQEVPTEESTATPTPTEELPTEEPTATPTPTPTEELPTEEPTATEEVTATEEATATATEEATEANAGGPERAALHRLAWQSKASLKGSAGRGIQ